MMQHSLTESLISAGLGGLFAMVLIVGLPPQHASVVITLLIAIAIVEIFRSHSADGPARAQAPTIGGDRQMPTDPGHNDDDTVPDRDDDVSLDLDTAPLIHQQRLDADQYPNGMIAADPTVTRFFDLLPDTVGAWQECHRLARLGAPKSADATPLLCWVRPPNEDRHHVVVQANNTELDAAYGVYYRYDDLTEGNSTGRRYMAVTHHEEFDTAADAAAYAIHWMETYPDGGPGYGTGSPGFPDPVEADPLSDIEEPTTYTVQTHPETDTTTITQRS